MLRRRLSRNPQAGQAIVLLALAMTLVFGMAALAIDGGMALLEQRTLRKAADLGALGGAGSIGAGGYTSALQVQVLKTAQSYAWQNLNAPMPTVTCTGSQVSGNTCTATGSNYSVSTSYPYTPQNGQSYPPANSVSVDIAHDFTTPGFQAALGVSQPCAGAQYTGGNTCVRVHAAAVVKAGSSNFPFALATRYLNVQGSTTTTVYGSSLIAQCAGDGSGDFIQNSANGGILTNGGSKFGIGQATQGGVVTSPASLLVANPAGTGCTGSNGNQNPVTSWSVLNNRVCFLTTCNGYNSTFAFNYDNLSPGWDDHCWQGGRSSDIQVSANPPSFEGSTGLSTPASPALASCTRAGNPPSYEGSYAYADFPGFPNFLSPTGVLSTSLGVNAPTRTYTTTPPSGAYAPGWYVFDGVGASIDGKKAIGCNVPTGADTIKGCVFTFQNGAHLDLNQGTVACGVGAGPCAFEFKASTGSATNYLAFNNKTDVNLLPISVNRTDPLTGLVSPFNMPIIFSADNTRCIGSGASGACAIVMTGSSGAFNVGGTIFAPHGVVNIKSNASPASGQLLADTVLLQGGDSSEGGAVAYKGSLNTPIPGPAALFE